MPETLYIEINDAKRLAFCVAKAQRASDTRDYETLFKFLDEAAALIPDEIRPTEEEIKNG